MAGTGVPPHCPVCCSHRVAEVLYGLPDDTLELKQALREKRVVLGGCVEFDDGPAWECTACGHQWGAVTGPPDTSAD
jgi:hypothetical protein